MGEYGLPVELQAAGYTVHTMREVYGEEVAQRLPDERWLKKCGREKWVVFSKDKRLRKQGTVQHRALLRWKIKAFVLSKQDLKEEEQIARYVFNKYRIGMRCRKPGPFICRVDERGLDWYLRPPEQP